MSGERRYYFAPGSSFRTLCGGDEVRHLRQVGELLGGDLVARDNWVEAVGPGVKPERFQSFFSALAELSRLRGRELESRDFELLLRSFRDHRENDLTLLWKCRIQVSPKRPEVLPRSRRQLEYVQAMRGSEVVFGIGPAGTGKTYLAMAMAVSSFLTGEVNRIVLTRPARESGERLGFLPGSLEEKVSPYLRPLYDALNEMLTPDEVQRLVASNVIEVAPLAFMRGRTLNKSFIILDEAQNTTPEQMLMFLTRMGFGSRCVVTGDPGQSDLGPGERSGLSQAVATLRTLPELRFIEFGTGDVVRHALLEKIITRFTGSGMQSKEEL